MWKSQLGTYIERITGEIILYALNCMQSMYVSMAIKLINSLQYQCNIEAWQKKYAHSTSFSLSSIHAQRRRARERWSILI